MTEKLTDKDRLDAMMTIADFRLDRWKNRREHEWKISASLWALLAAAIYKDATFPAWALIGVVLLHAFLWVRWNWVRNERDIRTAFFYVDHCDAILFGSPPPDKRPQVHGLEEWFGFLKTGVCVFQVITTALLAAAVYILTR